MQLAAAVLVPDKHPAPAGWGSAKKRQSRDPAAHHFARSGTEAGRTGSGRPRSFRKKQAMLREAVWSQWREDFQALGAPQFADELEDLLNAGRFAGF